MASKSNQSGNVHSVAVEDSEQGSQAGISTELSQSEVAKSDLSRTVVIIPMLNEEESIGLVLDHLPPVLEVVVCDNGSTDQSAEIAASKGATVVEQPERGYGAACLKGLEYVESMQTPPEIIVFLDGDFSDHPEEIHWLVQEIQQNGFDFVVGSRVRGNREKGAMLFQALFGNWLACSLMRLFWGVRYTDLGPFRAIKYQQLRSLSMCDRNFGWTIEMQIKAAEQKLRSTEVPVSYRCRIGKSKISGTIVGSFRAGYKILYTIFRYRFRSRSKSRAAVGNADGNIDE